MAASCVMSLVLLFLRQELDQLRARIQTIEDRIKPAQAELSSPSATSPEDNEDAQARAGLEEEEGREGASPEKNEREKAAAVIQTNWRAHRQKVGNGYVKESADVCPDTLPLIFSLHSILRTL